MGKEEEEAEEEVKQMQRPHKALANPTAPPVRAAHHWAEPGPLLPDVAQSPDAATAAGVRPQGRWLCAQVTLPTTGQQVLPGSGVWVSHLCVDPSTVLVSHLNWG